MQIISYPKAEQLANNIQLPVGFDQEVYELYGYKELCINTKLARKIAFENKIYSDDEMDAFISILEQRLNTMKEKNKYL